MLLHLHYAQSAKDPLPQLHSSQLKLSSINTIYVKQQHNVGFFIFKFTLKYILGNVYINKIHVRKFVNSLLNYPQQISLQNFKPLFPLILQILDLECHGETSLIVAFVKFAQVFMKFRKLESLCTENKKLHCHKTEAATGSVL